jgi:hypothetical protein
MRCLPGLSPSAGRERESAGSRRNDRLCSVARTTKNDCQTVYTTCHTSEGINRIHEKGCHQSLARLCHAASQPGNQMLNTMIANLIRPTAMLRNRIASPLLIGVLLTPLLTLQSAKADSNTLDLSRNGYVCDRSQKIC